MRIALHTGEAHERDGRLLRPRPQPRRSAQGARARRRHDAAVAGDRPRSSTTGCRPARELIDLGRQELRGLSRPEQRVRAARRGARRRRRAAASAHETRKTVTVLFACLVEPEPGLADARRRGAQPRQRPLPRRHARACSSGHGGTVAAYPGDALMAVFGVPRAARGRRRCGPCARRPSCASALPALGDELERAFGVRLSGRIGVGTGEVIAGDPAAGRPLASGHAVNAAKRLEELAGSGRDPASTTPRHRLVRGRSSSTEPAGAGDVAGSARSCAPATAGALPGTPLPARRSRPDSSRHSSSAFAAAVGGPVVPPRDRARRGGRGQVAPGRGVHRRARRAQATVLRGRCLPYGESITYWPLTEVVRDLAGSRAADPSAPPSPPARRTSRRPT